MESSACISLLKIWPGRSYKYFPHWRALFKLLMPSGRFPAPQYLVRTGDVPTATETGTGSSGSGVLSGRVRPKRGAPSG